MSLERRLFPLACGPMSTVSRFMEMSASFMHEKSLTLSLRKSLGSLAEISFLSNIVF
jgi:hypothetical protein